MNKIACQLCARFRLLTTSLRMTAIQLQHLSSESFNGDPNVNSEDESADDKLLNIEELPPRIRQSYKQLKALFPYDVPWNVDIRHRKQLEECKDDQSLFAALRSLNYLEQAKLRRLTKRALRAAVYQEFKAATYSTSKDSTTSPNTIFLWSRRKHYNLWNSHKLCQSYMFGEEVIIDCGFESQFASKVTKLKLHRLLRDQFEKIFLFNRERVYPAKIVLCNLDTNSELRTFVERELQELAKFTFIETTTKSYLELFDKKDLVYLSPDAKHDHLHKVQKGTKYILGGLPDTGGEFRRSTLAKAKREGLQCCKIPISDFIRFRGNTNMPMHKVFEFLTYARETGDMTTAAVATIPKERVYNEEDKMKVADDSKESLITFESNLDLLRGSWDPKDRYLS